MTKIIQRGFTMIELVIVIVLIAILAATALPKFSSMSTQARAAAAAGTAGALGSAVSIAHAQWLNNNKKTIVVLEDPLNPIKMSAQGWPEATSSDVSGTATAPKCLEVWNGILSGAPLASVGTCSNPCQYLVQVTASPICQFIDEQGNGTNMIQYNIATGAVSL